MVDKKPSAFDPDYKKTGAAFSPLMQASSASGPSLTPPSFHAERLAKVNLEGDEQLLWYGQPVASQMFRASLPFLIFSIPWTAFAVFWVFGAGQPLWGALAKGESDWRVLLPMALFPLFGLPFIGIGVSLFRKPWALAREAARTVYVLTNKRVLILKDKARLDVEAIQLGKLRGSLHLRERRGGTGDILFGSFAPAVQRGAGRRAPTLGFLCLTDVAEVHKKIGRAIEVAA